MKFNHESFELIFNLCKNFTNFSFFLVKVTLSTELLSYAISTFLL